MCAGLTALAAATGGAALGQVFVQLDPLPGGTTRAGGLAIGANTVGDYRIVGFSDATNSFAGEAWFYDLIPGTMTPTSIGALPSLARFSRAEGVNADGTVIVGTSNFDGTRPAGFVWTPAGMTQLGPVGAPSGVGIARAHAVSSAGDAVVGESTTSTSGVTIAHRWIRGSGGTTAQRIGALTPAAGSAQSFANDCSADGTVVVGQTTSPQGFQAFRWSAPLNSATGTIVPLGFIDPGESTAYGVSASGAIVVGSSSSNAAGGDVEAYIHTGAMHGLGVLPSPIPSSEAYDVSGNGRVAVGAARTGGTLFDPVLEAVVWNRRDGMRKLSTILGAIVPGSLRLETADGISGDGTVVTGSAVVIEAMPARRVAFVATIPAYCPADVNASGSVTVQDVFDFLGFFFANEPRADINQDWQISVQDVFDFLTLWFGGC